MDSDDTGIQKEAEGKLGRWPIQAWWKRLGWEPHCSHPGLILTFVNEPENEGTSNILDFYFFITSPYEFGSQTPSLPKLALVAQFQKTKTKI